AAFLDGLDGKVARLSRSTSKFGKELDSLADIISFGVAPAFLVHTAKLSMFGKWGFMVGAVFLMCGAFRLARYNILADPHKKEDFAGLPIPIAALAIASYMIASIELFGEIRFPQFLITMTIGCGALMVSTITYDAFLEKLDAREKRWRMVVIFLFLVAVLLRPRLAIFPFVAAYIIFGLAREMYRNTVVSRRSGKETDNVSK
ncbi:MAG: CDP-diacylglycerol--serine O-phosphatidyltransferase, partial [candidate division Zixibacteria bacterium]|nr:CDP-diacylglycerol--serine O-phosphatidyltransferase [candidate division Zixibacteria bacterium]